MDEEKLTRRELLQAGLGALAGAALPAPAAAAPFHAQASARVQAPQRRPNVVFIFADQLRACSVGCYGNDEIDTPHIDQLASEGVLFTNAISLSPLSAPYRACLICGRYPNITGVFWNSIKLPRGEIGIAEVFEGHGYRTKFVGKWFLNGPTPSPVEDPGWVPPSDRQGFRQWTGFNGGHVYYGGKYYVDRDPTPQELPLAVYEPDFQTDEAIRFLRDHRRDPLCLFMSIGTPHPQNIRSDLPPVGDYTFPYNPNRLTLRPNVDYPDLDYARKEYADYYGIISNFDWNVGRILTALEAFGLAEQTIVVVTSDHGDWLGSHYRNLGGFRGKSEIHAESLDVPCILRYPAKVAPALVSQVFSPVDIMPTLLGLCGLEIPGGVMGRDFAPLLTAGMEPIEPPWGPVPSTESALVGMFDGLWVGVRTPEYSLACLRSTFVPSRMYHNTVDTYQMNNIVHDPAYKEVRKSLHQEFLAWASYVGLEPG